MSNHLFVVDDDPGIGPMTALALRSEGYETVYFSSPLDALAKIQDSGEPDPVAVLLDLQMPEMDGREFFRQATLAGLASPVVIVSAYGAASAANELGAAAALPKPFQPEALLHTVQQVLSIE